MSLEFHPQGLCHTSWQSNWAIEGKKRSECTDWWPKAGKSEEWMCEFIVHLRFAASGFLILCCNSSFCCRPFAAFHLSSRASRALFPHTAVWLNSLSPPLSLAPLLSLSSASCSFCCKCESRSKDVHQSPKSRLPCVPRLRILPFLTYNLLTTKSLRHIWFPRIYICVCISVCGSVCDCGV